MAKAAAERAKKTKPASFPEIEDRKSMKALDRSYPQNAEIVMAAGQTEESEAGRKEGIFRAIHSKGLLKSGSTLLILIAMVVTFSLLSQQFLSKANIFNIFEQNAVLGIIACGMAFMIIIGGFDLSVGSVAALTGVVVGLILQKYPGALILAVLAGLGVGATAGLCNGLFISKVGINPFITTSA
jgi:ABC-type xylose transport system permease subunit